jgi:single-strand DNA-binding protein
MSINTINEVRLRGYVGTEPQVVTLEDKPPYGRLSIATHAYWKKADGQSAQRTDWHSVCVFNGKVSLLSQLQKGDCVDVKATLITREMTDPQGKVRQVPSLVARDLVKVEPFAPATDEVAETPTDPVQSLKEALAAHPST